MASSPHEIQQKMLHSALNWKTIWVDGINTDLTISGNDSAHEQLWIDQAGARFRFLTGPVDGAAQTCIISDGSSKLSMDLGSGVRQVTALPPGLAGQFVPVLASGAADQPNPLGELTTAWASNMVFSSYWAQNPTAELKPVGLEMVAGRQTLIVDYAALGTRIWLDVGSGIILKQQRFGEGGGSMVEQYVITRVEYDIPALPEQLFSLNPASRPAFSDVMGNLPVTPAPASAADNSEQYQVVTKSNPSNGQLTDVYIKNSSTRAETLFITLADVNSGSYHVGEYHNGSLYIIRRKGDPQVDQNWSDQLWRYDQQGSGEMLFSSKGLDFRVSPDGSAAAVAYQTGDPSISRLAFIDKNAQVLREFDIDPTGMYADNPLQWSADGSLFWGALQFDTAPKTLYQVSVSDWTVKKIDVSPLNIGGEFELNANTGQIVYSDYPAFFDTNSNQQFIDNATKVHLFLYDLNTQALQTIATATARHFSPQWLDNVTIAYDDPNGGARIDYRIK